MRTISAQAITQVVARLCIRANTVLPEDVRAALTRARQAEPWPLAQLYKDAGHAGVLADGQLLLFGQSQVVLEQAQRLLGEGPGLLPAAAVQGGGYVLGQTGIGPDTQPGHGGGEVGGRNGSHQGSSSPVKFSAPYFTTAQGGFQ